MRPEKPKSCVTVNVAQKTVAKKDIIQSYEKEGVRMKCIESSCTSQKRTWIRRYFSDAWLSSCKDLLIRILPNVENIVIFGRQMLNHLSKVCKKSIRKYVFLAFCKLGECIDE
jgi:hypothetical protein